MGQPSIEGPKLDYLSFLRWQRLGDGELLLASELSPGTVLLCEQELEYATRVLGRKQVTVRLFSPGGDAYSALALYDALMAARARGVELTVYAEGLAASAAAMIILQAADRRVCTPNTYFMLHEVQSWYSMPLPVSGLEEHTDQARRIQTRVVDIMSTRMGRPREEIRDLIERRSTWFTAEDAVNAKLVDEIA